MASKRSHSPAKRLSPKARQPSTIPKICVVAGTLHCSNGSEADCPGRTGVPRSDTSGAVRSSGADRIPELSSDLFASLESADDPLMQQIGSLLSAQQAKNDDLEKRLATSDENARSTTWYVITRSVVFLLSTTIVITWLINSNRLSCRTSLIMLPVSTSRISIGVLPSLRSSGGHFLFSSNF